MQKELKHTINLHPSYFGPQTAEYILNKLHSDVEGTCSGRLGYIIAVLGVGLSTVISLADLVYSQFWIYSEDIILTSLSFLCLSVSWE